MIDESQRRAARLIGIAYPLTFAIITGAFFRFYAPFVAWNDFAATAGKLMSHEHDFRLYNAAALIYGIGVVVLLTALYVVLRPISRSLALFAASSRLVYALLWFVMQLNLFAALRLMSGVSYLQGFELERLQALAGLQLASGQDAYYLGLGFYGLGSTVFSYLWFKSRYVPRTLAVWGLLSSLFEGCCGFAYLVFPHFGSIVSVNWYELPMGLFELALSFWILARGLRPPQAAEALRTSS